MDGNPAAGAPPQAHARTGLSRWRTPLLAAAAVIVIGGAAALVIHYRDNDGAVAEAASGAGDQPQASSPDSVVTDYGIALGLFDSHPDNWGGAFVDGDVLVVKYVNQSEPGARKALDAAGASAAIRLEKADVSMSDFDRARQALTALAKERRDFASWGPDYETSSIVLKVTDDPPGLAQQLGTVENVPVKLITNVKRGTT